MSVNVNYDGRLSFILLDEQIERLSPW